VDRARLGRECAVQLRERVVRGDNTFTAEARYGGNTRVQSGTWAAEGENLHLTSGNTKRDYTYKLEGNALTVTDPKSKHAITLDRIPK